MTTEPLSAPPDLARGSAEPWQIAAALVTAPSLTDRLDLLLRAAPRVGGMDSAAIYLRDDPDGGLRAIARFGHAPGAFGPPRRGGLTELVLRTRAPVIVEDATADARVSHAVVEAGVRAFVALPLIVRRPVPPTDAAGAAGAGGDGRADARPPSGAAASHAIGVLYVNAHRPRRFDPHTIDALNGLAALAAVTIENGRLLEAQRETAQRLTEVLDAREQFVSLVSHELKGPLTPLKGYVQAIARRFDRATAAGQPVDEVWLRRALRVMSGQIERLDRLITDLLDVSRARAGRFTIDPRPADLIRVASDAFERFRETMAAEVTSEPASVRHALRWRAVGESLPGVWDATRLEQLVLNLLSNAVKYSPDGGEVELCIEPITEPRAADEALWRRAPEIAPGWAHVTVRDEGIGLAAATSAEASAPEAPEPHANTGTDLPGGTGGEAPVDPDHPELFRAFSRSREAEAEGIRGFGLGLFICAQIVRRHGGAIWAESPGAGQGSTFHVLLPPRPPHVPS